MKRILVLMTIVIALATGGFYDVVSAATHEVVGKSNGSSCSSGGSFTPSSITINDGDTITFSNPSSDPYKYGLQVNGFPEGSFVVPWSGSKTTQPLHANVSYAGTWPSRTDCPKGGGTVSVAVAASSPPAASTQPPASSPNSSPEAAPDSTETPTPTLYSTDNSQSADTSVKNSNGNKAPYIALGTVLVAGAGFAIYWFIIKK